MADAVVREGDQVTAGGNIIEDDSSVLTLCPVEPSRYGDRVGCFGPHGIRVTGIDPRGLPGSIRGGRWVTTFVSVTGTWNDGSIAVSSATPAEQPPVVILHPVPCDAPVGGWPGFGDDPDAVVLAGGRLRTELESKPTLYGGWWTSTSSGSGAVLVVGTVGDVESIAPNLHRIYPFSLCVTHVTFDTATLSEVATRLSKETDWAVDVDPASNRVAVAVTVFDEATAMALSADMSTVLVKPLVKKSGPSM